MNKLVSKNPVQRFKQGRKIIKAQNSWGEGFGIENTGNIFGPKISLGYNTTVIPEEGEVKFNTSTTRLGFNVPGVNNGIHYSHNLPTTLEYTSTNEKNVESPQQTKKGKPGTKKGKTTTLPQTTFMGVKRGGSVKNFTDAINAEQKAKLIASGSFKESDFADTRSFQKALNRYFGKDGYGSVVADNKWGNQTQRAFDEALKKINAPVVNTTEGIKFQGPKPSLIPTHLNEVPKINVPKPVTNFGYRTSNTYENNDFSDRLKNMGIRSNADLIDFMHRTNGENYNWNGDNWARQFRSDVNQALGGDYSDANIRKVFNTSNNWHRGFLGRGDLGDFQNALQTYAGTWNGSYDRNLGNYVKNIDWSKFKLYKKGGQLLSRNIIERFKTRNFS